MKFCYKCGKELLDDAVLCPHCGCMVNDNKNNSTKTIEISSNISESEICPSFIRYLIIGLCFSEYEFFAYSYYSTFNLIMAIISLITVIGLCVFGLCKRWTHYLVGKRPYPISFILYLIFSGVITLVTLVSDSYLF